MRPNTAGLTTQICKTCWCHIAQTAMRLVVIIIHPPTPHNVFCLISPLQLWHSPPMKSLKSNTKIPLSQNNILCCIRVTTCQSMSLTNCRCSLNMLSINPNFHIKNVDYKKAYKLLFTTIMKVIMPTKISKSYGCWIATSPFVS